MNIIEETNKCVKCGLCLSSCPTFNLTKNENESPRGRISLIQGLASGQLKPTKSLITALDHCLQCGKCEAVCPAKVNYSSLIRETRKTLSQQGFSLKSTLRTRLITYALWIYKQIYRKIQAS